jgi:hypothetical protein
MKIENNDLKITLCFNTGLRFKVKFKEKIMEENLRNQDPNVNQPISLPTRRDQWKIAFFVLLGVNFLIGSFYFGHRLRTKESGLAETPTPTIFRGNITPTPVKDLTTSPTEEVKKDEWRTFTGKNKIIKVLIPPDWKATDAKPWGEPGVIPPDIIDYIVVYSPDSNYEKGPGSDISGMTFTLIAKKGQASNIDDLYSKFIKENPYYTGYPKEKTAVAKLLAFKIKTDVGDTYIFKNDTTIFEFRFGRPYNIVPENYDLYLERIIKGAEILGQ